MDGSITAGSWITGLSNMRLTRQYLELHRKVCMQRTPRVSSSFVMLWKGWWVPSWFPRSH